MSRILAVEFDGSDKLCRIVRTSGTSPGVLDVLATGHRLVEVDVDWCDRDQCYYQHDSGSWTGRVYLSPLVDGIRHRLWAKPEATFSRADGKGEMISAAEVEALGYDLDYGDRPDLKALDMSYGTVHWCERCDDMIPDSDHCFDHEYWCDECGDFYQKKGGATGQCEHFCEECSEAATDWCKEDH